MGPAKKLKVASVLDANVYGSYHPKSRDTKLAYRTLLLLVQERLGDHPPEILYGAAEEVLGVLKNEHMRVRCLLPLFHRAGRWDHGSRQDGSTSDGMAC
jgi:hypothetical protein